jgi:hypothetical protein
MIRRIKLVRAGLVRATASAIVRAVRLTEQASEGKGRIRVRARLTLSMFPFLLRKTYIISTRIHHAH